MYIQVFGAKDRWCVTSLWCTFYHYLHLFLNSQWSKITQDYISDSKIALILAVLILLLIHFCPWKKSHHIHPCQSCPSTLVQKIFVSSNKYTLTIETFSPVSPTFPLTLICRICQTPWTQPRSLTNWAFTHSATVTGTSRPLVPRVVMAYTKALTGWPTSSRTRSEVNLWTTELQFIREHQWVSFIVFTRWVWRESPAT